jgi:hypothetical protein
MVKNPKGSSAVPEPLAPPIVVLPQLRDDPRYRTPVS